MKEMCSSVTGSQKVGGSNPPSSIIILAVGLFAVDILRRGAFIYTGKINDS